MVFLLFRKPHLQSTANPMKLYAAAHTGDLNFEPFATAPHRSLYAIALVVEALSAIPCRSRYSCVTAWLPAEALRAHRTPSPKYRTPSSKLFCCRSYCLPNLLLAEGGILVLPKLLLAEASILALPKLLLAEAGILVLPKLLLAEAGILVLPKLLLAEAGILAVPKLLLAAVGILVLPSPYRV